MKRLRIRWNVVIGVALMIVLIYYGARAAYYYREKLISPIASRNWEYASSLAVDGDFEYETDGTEVEIIVHSMSVDREELTCRVGFYNLYSMYKGGVSVDMLLDLYNDYLSEPDLVIPKTESKYLVEYTCFWHDDRYINLSTDYPDYDRYQSLVCLVLKGYRYDIDRALVGDEFNNDEIFGESVDWQEASEEQIQIACDYVNQNEAEELYKIWYHVE